MKIISSSNLISVILTLNFISSTAAVEVPHFLQSVQNAFHEVKNSLNSKDSVPKNLVNNNQGKVILAGNGSSIGSFSAFTSSIPIINPTAIPDIFPTPTSAAVSQQTTSTTPIITGSTSVTSKTIFTPTTTSRSGPISSATTVTSSVTATTSSNNPQPTTPSNNSANIAQSILNFIMNGGKTLGNKIWQNRDKIWNFTYNKLVKPGFTVLKNAFSKFFNKGNSTSTH